MATKFQEIYGLFLNQITDYELGGLEREEIEAIAEIYLLNSLLTVQQVSDNIMDIDEVNKQFNYDLSLPEKLLLAKAMKLTWVRRQKYQQELMRKTFSDTDFKGVQGTEYLKALSDVEAQLEDEIRKELIRNSWRKSGSYNSLGG